MSGEIIGKHPNHQCDPPAMFGHCFDSFWIELGDVWRCGCGKTWVAVHSMADGYSPRNQPTHWRREHFWEKWRR